MDASVYETCSNFYTPALLPTVMAKDSFFIRIRNNTASTTYVEVEQSLGAFVDALGEAVLRIHNIAVAYENQDGSPFLSTLASTRSTAWQLTTQSQTAMVSSVDKSIVSAGRLRETVDVGGALEGIFEEHNINPMDWSKGYLVGVESIHLGVDMTVGAATAADNAVVLILECTVEKLSKGAALALALSQQ